MRLGAENETRTRDPNHGKVVLYQLSYFRNIFAGVPDEREGKDRDIFRFYKIFFTPHKKSTTFTEPKTIRGRNQYAVANSRRNRRSFSK